MNGEWKKKRRFRQNFARLLQKMLRKPLLQAPYTGTVNSVIILAQEKYGDAILLTPLLRLLKRHFPDSTVHVVTFSRATYSFFQSDRNIDILHLARGNAWPYYRHLLSRRFDILFNTKDHPSTSFLFQSLLVRARYKVGIDCDYHRGIYDYLVDLDFHTPVALKNCGLLDILGKSVHPYECRPYLPEKPVSETVQAFLKSMQERTCTGINISAGGPTRYWTEENWKKLADAFPGITFVVFSAPCDREKKNRLERQCPNVMPSPETANLYEAGLIVGKLKLLVTPDTALVHVAACVNTPVLGLYGTAPQDQSRFMPFLVKHKVVVSPTALVKEISADKVIAALQAMVSN
ncbi:MAG: glycosyltransferase family 9 protein [Chlorobium sp.]|uniref:glycosyltransferase family 9 protein n=1 Tax=Chlorobium sp. TaxID=1095 RepID=UPI0025C693EC|nr:glycosyltransferase family 9 protein [Chlorobium sp.]MCF8384104.1 glycosyltransferase family 9 protein [Chlorobium sp.]